MSKKTMLLALAVASVAMFALPAASSANELHLTNVSSFEGDTTAGTLVGGRTITCETGHVAGTVNAGGTTGSITLDFTGCHTTVFGFTAKCRTAGSPLDNTIRTTGTYHLITTETTVPPAPAILTTTDTVTIVCAGISNTVVHGSVIGMITSPACGVASKTMTINYAADPNNSATQAHETWTGKKDYDLTATTGEGGESHTAVLTTLTHTESENAGTLDCT